MGGSDRFRGGTINQIELIDFLFFQTERIAYVVKLN